MKSLPSVLVAPGKGSVIGVLAGGDYVNHGRGHDCGTLAVGSTRGPGRLCLDLRLTDAGGARLSDNFVVYAPFDNERDWGPSYLIGAPVPSLWRWCANRRYPLDSARCRRGTRRSDASAAGLGAAPTPPASQSPP